MFIRGRSTLVLPHHREADQHTHTHTHGMKIKVSEFKMYSAFTDTVKRIYHFPDPSTNCYNTVKFSVLLSSSDT